MPEHRSLLNTLLHSVVAPVRAGASAAAEAASQAGTAMSGMVAQTEAQLHGTGADALVAHAANFAGQDPFVAGAALAGMAAAFLGTHAGRALAGEAIAIGGLTLIGGLARKAYYNATGGLPPEASKGPVAMPPMGCPFNERAHTEESVDLLLQAMVATAAAAGTAPDWAQRAAILRQMREAGLTVDQSEFLERAIAAPASPEQIGARAHTPQLAAQVYAAAMLVARPGNAAEQAFLARLAAALHLPKGFVGHLDAAIAA